MRAMVIRRFGEADAFEPAELPDPRPGPGQVLVRQVATSVNPVDWKLRRHGPPGIAPELPAVLGCDISGRVEAVGEGVTAFGVGDGVYGCGAGVRGMGGAYAGFVLTDADLLAARPASLSAREAAALPLVTITAWEGLVDRARVEKGQNVLVIGGTGGVGHVAIQIAKAKGARVVATVSSERKADLARGLGADLAIDRRGKAMADIVREAGAGDGFDLVFDTVGEAAIAKAFEAARPLGTVVTITSRAPVDLTPMHDKSLSLHVVYMLVPMLSGRGRAAHGAILREAAALADAGRLRPLVDPERFPLERVADAHRRLEAGEATGKLVVDIAPEAVA